MAILKLLHASDLHICEYEKIRSPIDHLQDLEDPLSLSFSGIASKARMLAALRKDMRLRMASSFDPESLLLLSEFIYDNARWRKDGARQKVEGSGEKLDGVILTGDLATSGEREDIEKVALLLTADFNPRFPYKASEGGYREATLSALEIPIIVLPGNHDRYMETKRKRNGVPIFFEPASPNFDRFVRDYRPIKQPIHKTVLSTAITKSSNLNVAVLCADFTLQDIEHHEGMLGWLAQGMAYEGIRKILIEETKSVISQKAADDTVCILWAIHFPPYFPGIKKHSQLLGEEFLMKDANELGVRAILAGHTHQQLQYQTPGMNSQCFCCGTTTQYEPQALLGGKQQNNVRVGNHFQILTITANPGFEVSIKAQHYRYCGKTDPDGGPTIYEWLPAS